MIKFEKVSKKYGPRVILDEIDLLVKPGEFVTITGPSGAGKSTIVHLIIGAEQPSSGKIFVDEADVGNLDCEAIQEYRRNIGVVFQDYKLLPKKTVFENIAYSLEVLETPDAEILELVPKVLEKVGLHEHLDHYPHQLSGGEAQRAALARALIHEPKLLIADEPTGNLDPKNAAAIMKLLLELNRGGITVLLVTHNPELLKLTPKQIFKLENRKLVAI